MGDIIKSQNKNRCSILSNTPHIRNRKGSSKMERTYVLNFIFKVMAAAGIISVLGIAGASDFGSITNAEIFVYGGISFLMALIGIWGFVNCTRAIEAHKRHERREKARRVAAICSAKAA